MAEEARNPYWVQVSLSSLKNSPKGQDQRRKGDTAEQAWKDRWTLACTAMMQDIQENPECASPVIQAAFGFSLSCDLPTYPPPHIHRKTPLFTGGSSSFQTLIQVFPVQLPAGLLCHVYPDNHSSPLQGFSSSRASNMKSPLREGKRDQVKRHPQRDTTENRHVSLQKEFKELSSAVDPTPTFGQESGLWQSCWENPMWKRVKLGWTGEESPWGSPAKGVQWCLT